MTERLPRPDAQPALAELVGAANRAVGAVPAGRVAGRAGRGVDARVWRVAGTAGFVAAVVLVTTPFLIVAVHLVTLPTPIHLEADQALIDIDVRTALGFHLLLGPYDRFGWHHPGPAFAYLLSVVARIAGPGGRADALGALAINAAAALGVVLLIRRRAGRLAALWAAACMLTMCTRYAPPNFVAPWGPNVLALPTVLLGVLCACAACRSVVALLGALVVAGFLVQTQLGTAPVALALLATAAVVMLVGRRGRPAARHRLPPTRRRALAGSLTAVLVVMWLPTVLEQLGHLGDKARPLVVSALHPLARQVDPSQGNLVAIWHFVTSPHTGHSVSSVIDLVAPHPAMLVLLVGAGAASVIWGREVAGGLGARLGLVSLVVDAATLVALVSVPGPIQRFDITWDSAVPVLAAIALGVTVLGRANLAVARRTRPAHGRAGPVPGAGRWIVALGLPAAVLAVAVVSGAWFGTTMAAWQVRQLSSPAATATWRFVGPQLRTTSSVLVRPVNAGAYGIAAGLADELVARGVRVTIPAGWAPEFGAGRVSTGGEATEVLLHTGARPVAGPVANLFRPVPGKPGDKVLVVRLHPPSN